MLYHDCTAIRSSPIPPSETGAIRYLSYNPLTAPNTAAPTTANTHRLCLKSIPSFFPLRIPQQKQHRSHHHTLIDVIPRLYRHSIKSYSTIRNRSHQIFVVQSTHSTHDRCSHHGKQPSVMLEVDTFFLATFTQQEKRKFAGSRSEAKKWRFFLNEKNSLLLFATLIETLF